MKKYTIIFMLPLITFLFNGCARTEGCKDKNATNYNSEANKNCKCCKYRGTVVFWYDKAVADLLQSQGSYSLNYYIDEKLMLTGMPNLAWNYPPECGQKSSVTIAMDLEGNKSKSFSYRIEDSQGDDLWIGTQTFEGNICTKVELSK